MDAFAAEDLKQQVQYLLSESISPRQKLLIIKNYYSLLISNAPSIIAETYINEFFDEFLNSLNKFDVFYLKPQITSDIIKLLATLKQFYSNNETIKVIDNLIVSLNIKLDLLN